MDGKHTKRASVVVQQIAAKKIELEQQDAMRRVKRLRRKATAEAKWLQQMWLLSASEWI